METAYRNHQPRICGYHFAKTNECRFCPHHFVEEGKTYCRYENCVTVKILDKHEMALRNCRSCSGFAGMKGPDGDCWGYCRNEKCTHIRKIPYNMFKEYKCKDCLYHAGRKDGRDWCQKEYCDLVDEAYTKYAKKQEEKSDCYKCPYANPMRPCVGFCMKRMIRGVRQ